MSFTCEFFDFLKKSPSPYHAIATVVEELVAAGFERLPEEGALKCGKYYTVRDGSSLIAFELSDSQKGFSIVASHSDSPSFKIKTSSERVGAYTTLDVERYGGMIFSSWFDRPLSVAGRAVVKTEDGLKIMLADIARNLAVIPNVAIHFNRAVNDGYKYNPATDLLPLVSQAGGKGVMELIS